MPLMQRQTAAPKPCIDPELARRIRDDLRQAHGPDTTFLDRLDAIERSIEALLVALEAK
jgi:hypothetical protein